MTGQTISHYRVLEKLGEGGMGVVYKAEDTKLRRTVALKFLPPDNRERFLREAQAAAALNHPNICTVFEIDEEHGFLAMELIDGMSVKDKIAARPLPLEEALDIAQQACAGLAAAHEKGIVHRDIKPANLMLTAQGQVKIMDFGLAQVGDRTRITKTGSSLGTPAYMSPEQAKGDPVDRRTDIWSLGVVLYEMIAGRLPFRGDTEQAVTYGIVHSEPEPLTAQRAGLPLDLDRIAAKALAKDPGSRYQHVEDLLVDLRRTPSPTTARRQHRNWRVYLPWAIAAIAIITLIAVSIQRTTPASGPGSAAVSMVIPIPPEQELLPGGQVPFDVSKDGSKLVYAASEGGRIRLFLRPVDAFDARVLPGTEDARAPFFSPDGRWIGYSVRNQFYKVASTGGAPIQIPTTEAPGVQASWGEDDHIVYSSPGGLRRISASGGPPTTLTVRKPGEPQHLHPWLLPGNAGVLFSVGGDQGSVAVVSLKGGTPAILFPGRLPQYVASGHVIYAVNDALRAVPFDAKSLKVTGSHTPVLEDVYTSAGGGNPYFRLSSVGTLFYVTGRNEHSLVRVNRAGHATPLTSRRLGYRLPRISRDGKLIAVTIDPPDETQSHTWIFDLARGTLDKLTHDRHNLLPFFTPDGTRVAWLRYAAIGGNADVYWQAADGSGKAEPLQRTADQEFPRDFTPDGKTLIYERFRAGQPRKIWVAPVDGVGQPSPLLESPFSEEYPRLSPDGRWIAYASNESGREEIYVRRFPQSERKWTVTSDGGLLPVWSRDGKEIFYLEGKRMMAIPVETGAGFSTGKPVFLFDHRDLTGGDVAFDVMSDGFLMVQRDPLGMLTEFRVVINWPAQWK